MFVPGVSQSAKSRRSFAIVFKLSKLNDKISLLYYLNNYFYSLFLAERIYRTIRIYEKMNCIII